MVDHELEWAASWQLRSDQQEWLGARPRRQALRLTAHRCAASGLDRPSGPSRRQACRNEGAAGKFRAARLTCPIDHIMTPHMDDGEHRREAMAPRLGSIPKCGNTNFHPDRRAAAASLRGAGGAAAGLTEHGSRLRVPGAIPPCPLDVAFAFACPRKRLRRRDWTSHTCGALLWVFPCSGVRSWRVSPPTPLA
jgi:hypothetical protein